MTELLTTIRRVRGKKLVALENDISCRLWVLCEVFSATSAVKDFDLAGNAEPVVV
jgi:hypothetical protein